MSVTESKTKTERKSSRKPAKTQETVLSALLEQTEEVSVSLASLIKSPLNVRTVPYSAESVSELAESIKGVGLLQNLVVHALPGDRHGVRSGNCKCQTRNQKGVPMGNEKSLAHTRWNCKYHIVFAPKYRRQVFYREKRRAIGSILRKLCEWKRTGGVRLP